MYCVIRIIYGMTTLPPHAKMTTRPDNKKIPIVEIELNIDDYLIHNRTKTPSSQFGPTLTIRKDGLDEKYKPKYINARWSDKVGVPNWWGWIDDDGMEFKVKWIDAQGEVVLQAP